MLASFLDIKPASCKPVVDTTPRDTSVASDTTKSKLKSVKKPLKPLKKSAGAKSQTLAKPQVEPYEGGASLARFKAPAQGVEPTARFDIGPATACETLDACEDEGTNTYEYLFQEAECSVSKEEDDTDSCLTFDDDASHASRSGDTDIDALGTSPADVSLPADIPFFSRRKAKASEAPVYAGPGLWYEDDDFIV